MDPQRIITSGSRKFLVEQIVSWHPDFGESDSSYLQTCTDQRLMDLRDVADREKNRGLKVHKRVVEKIPPPPKMF